MTNKPVDTLIIGAGMAGLTAAHTLSNAGQIVHVIDKGRGLGGRLATRRIGDARLDHGAQFFTVRSEPFAELVDEAIAAGVAQVWTQGFGAEDGYPRYCCPGGMSGLAKWMAGELPHASASIDLSTKATQIRSTTDHWHVELDGQSLRANSLIATPPVPQTLELIAAGGVELEPDIGSQLDAITYKPVFALLLTLDRPSAVPAPGGVQQPDASVFTFIGDNQQKGVSETPAVTFHVSSDISARRWDDDADAIMADLLPEAAVWLGDAVVLDQQLHKWKFTGPATPHPERHLVATSEPHLVLAGDAFGGPKVEGAFLSGLSAANALLAEF